MNWIFFVHNVKSGRVPIVQLFYFYNGTSTTKTSSRKIVKQMGTRLLLQRDSLILKMISFVSLNGSRGDKYPRLNFENSTLFHALTSFRWIAVVLYCTSGTPISQWPNFTSNPSYSNPYHRGITQCMRQITI